MHAAKEGYIVRVGSGPEFLGGLGIIVVQGEGRARHCLRGYELAVFDRVCAAVILIWDVLDRVRVGLAGLGLGLGLGLRVLEWHVDERVAELGVVDRRGLLLAQRLERVHLHLDVVLDRV